MEASSLKDSAYRKDGGYGHQEVVGSQVVCRHSGGGRYVDDMGRIGRRHGSLSGHGSKYGSFTRSDCRW